MAKPLTIMTVQHGKKVNRLLGFCSPAFHSRELCRMHASGEYSISDLTELFSVSQPTVYRTLARNVN